MILQWKDLAECYGNKINNYKINFETAGRTTFALLFCSKYTYQEHSMMESSNGVHAEEKLLETDMWKKEIPKALKDSTELSGSRIIVTMVINRSPCELCSPYLISALNRLHYDFPVQFEKSCFILASKGYYEDKKFKIATKVSTLKKLKMAGWRLCVLQTGDKISKRGYGLLKALTYANLTTQLSDVYQNTGVSWDEVECASMHIIDENGVQIKM